MACGSVLLRWRDGVLIAADRLHRSDAERRDTDRGGHGPRNRPTAGWVTSTSAAGHVTIKHPAGWHQQLCPGPNDTSIPGVVMSSTLALDAAACGEAGFGTVMVRFAPGDHRSDFDIGTSQCGTAETPTTVTISGVAGTRTRVDYDQGSDAACSQPPTVGAFAIRYVFFDGNRSFFADYGHDPAQNRPDDSATFDTMVQRTLSFTP